MFSLDGGIIRATNGNSSYGDFGAVADGIDPEETVRYGYLNTRNQQAQIASAFAGEVNDFILALEFTNCGQDYTTASYSITSSGVGARAIQEEFRDNALFTVEVFTRGEGLTQFGNQAQAGDAFTITLAANAAVTQSPSAAYYYDKTLQYNFNYYVDDDNGSVDAAMRTRIGDQLLFNATAATPTTLVSGQMQNILNRNLLPYVVTTNAARNGWIMAIADDEAGNEYRRGIEDIN
jgi:hypothetical protein